MPGALAQWDEFAASWTRLVRDQYMGDGGRYRFRRHATFVADGAGSLERLAQAPHYQGLDYNPLNGGIARWFEPVEQPIGAGLLLRSILLLALRTFGVARFRTRWHIEVHQFRIVAQGGREGRPTPEGVHRDGVDFVLVMMIRRQNIGSGRTDLYEAGAAVASFTLTDPASAVMLDDRRLAHGVTPVVPVEPLAESYRDVLVVTFRGEPAS